jgi:predicted lipid-binding transport protein (Tim44 family)
MLHGEVQAKFRLHLGEESPAGLSDSTEALQAILNFLPNLCKYQRTRREQFIDSTQNDVARSWRSTTKKVITVAYSLVKF